MVDVKLNEGVLFPCTTGKKIHYIGDMNVNGEEYKLYGMRDGQDRVLDVSDGADKVAVIRLKINEGKKPQGKQPDYKGSFLCQDRNWEVAGWVRDYETKGLKKKLLSLVVQSPRDQPAAPPVEQEDDDAPF